jgi:hypothetical protein
VPNKDNSSDGIASAKYTAKSETERVFSVFDTFGKDAEETKSSSVKDATSNNQPVLTMSSIGKLGRFGNQLFQYAFLRICAEKSGARVECPPWIGQTLFGHNDALISKQLPPAIERWEVEKNMFDLVPEFIPYIEKLASLPSTRVGLECLEEEIVNVDIWGYFQVHTQFLRPYKEYFQSLFQPVDDLKSALEDGLNILRSQGKTIVGIHIRRGDYITQSLSRYTFVVPSKWWCDWLDKIWNELEEPILFLCSDDVESIIDDFQRFSPVTWKDLDVKLPERMKDLGVEFYIDFFILSNCDVVGISNSSFSFAACLLNERGKMFVRPHRNFSTKFTVFEPWNSQPVLHMGSDQSKFLKSWRDALYVTYVTQGIWAMLKCLFIYIPKQRLEIWSIRANLGYKVTGRVGVIQSFLYTLGWHSAWKIPSKPN